MPELKRKFADSRVLIIGLGLQGGGVAVAEFFAELGANIRITDLKSAEELLPSINKLKHLSISYTLGKHLEKDFLEADLIIKAPKMRWDHPLILAAQKKGVLIEMETSFFASYCPAPIIGITGTRGKSTTTMMIYDLLKKHSGKKVFLAGNIPDKPALNLLKEVTKNDLLILELSSWQLSGFQQKKISPHISVFTNFYPDHLDYYQSMAEYLEDKKAIYLHQKSADYLVANSNLQPTIKKNPPTSKIIYFSAQNLPLSLANSKNLHGLHNRENAAAAIEVAKILKIREADYTNTLKSFTGLPFRQQIIGEKEGIIFVNDTTATTPTATSKALERFSNQQVVLILGGNAKELPTSDLVSSLVSVNKIILLSGTFTDEIGAELQKKYLDKIAGPFSDLQLAISEAWKIAKSLQASSKNKKIIVLFSPAATSFSMFKNEFHRGEEFNRLIKKLI